MRFATTLLVASIVLALGGCGSDGSDEADAPAPTPTRSQPEVWADDFCSAATVWRTEFEAASAQLTDTSNLSAESVRSSLQTMSEVTSTFVTDLDDLGSPGTDAGDQAQQTVEDLASTLGQQRQVVSEAIDGTASEAGIIKRLGSIRDALSTMGTALSDTATILSSVSASDELSAAFESSETCGALDSPDAGGQ